MPSVGEAVKALPAEILDSQPNIPWTQIARMRDHLAHRYFDTNHAVLQATVENDLPELERALQSLAEALLTEDQHEEDPPAQSPINLRPSAHVRASWPPPAGPS
jgi:Protein of unknown function DUF86